MFALRSRFGRSTLNARYYASLHAPHSMMDDILDHFTTSLNPCSLETLQEPIETTDGIRVWPVVTSCMCPNEVDVMWSVPSNANAPLFRQLSRL